VLFLSVYQIANYFYPLDDAESVRNWWLLKVDLYAVVVGLAIVITTFDKYKDIKLARVQSFITSVGVGFAISNFIDRRFLNDRVLDMNDLLIIMFIIAMSQIRLTKILNKVNRFDND